MAKRRQPSARARISLPPIEERVDRLVDLLREGISIMAAADAAQVSRAAVHNWFHEESERGDAIRMARADGIVAMHRGAAEPDGGGHRWLLARVGRDYGYGDRQVIAVDQPGEGERSEQWTSIAAAAAALEVAGRPTPDGVLLDVEEGEGDE